MYRGIIIVFMLEGHVLRELLSPDFRLTQFFSLHEIFHGITAPGFLFGAGFSFAITAQRRWEVVTSFSYGFIRRALRAVMFIFIGYALHFPFLSLQKTLSSISPTQLDSFLFFDVLQCIGFSLLFMRLLLVIIKKEKLFIVTLSFLLLVIVYLTPFLWTESVRATLGTTISLAINGLNGSTFPLFPYSGFLLAGVIVSWLFLRVAQKGREAAFINHLTISGVIIIALGLLLDALPFNSYSNYLFWNTSPNYFWIRLGVLFLLLSGLWFLEDFFASKDGSAAWMPKWLIVLGVESLFVYIVHLIILCGWVINPEFNLRWWTGQRIGYFEAFLVFIVVIVVMIYASFIWRYFKKKHPVLMNGVFWWMGFCIVWSFLFNPY